MAYQDPKTFEGRVVRLTDIVGDEGELVDYTFVDCQIKGPGIVVLFKSTITNCDFGGTFDQILWEIPPSRTVVVGAIAARNCTFSRCTFTRVGFAGPPDVIQNFLASVKKK